MGPNPDNPQGSPPGPPQAPPASGEVARANSGHAGALLQAVEHEIIPRLMRAHPPSLPNTVQAFPDRGVVSATELRDFVDQVMHGSDEAVQQCLDGLRARGIAFQKLWLGLLAPAAREMGERWCSDQCDFNEVTVAVGRLQQVLRDHGRQLSRGRTSGSGLSILLAASPGEQHTFGLSMVAELFHQAGWDVSTSFLSLHQPPARLVRDHWYDVVGLTLGGTAHLDRLVQCIEDIREASQNRGVPIIVGGPIFVIQPELAAQLKVDAVITEGSAAPALAESLVKRLKVRA